MWRRDSEAVDERLAELAPMVPRRMPVEADGPNPIQDMLDRCDFPWATSLDRLVARFGVSRHPAYDWDIVAIRPDPLPLTGMIYPIAANDSDRQRAEAPDYFFTHVWVRDDALANVQEAAGVLGRLLGPAPIGTRGSNTVGCEWVAGPASISLTTFPPTMQHLPPSIPAHNRDPRLRTACQVAIYPGFRHPLSPREREWLRGCRELMTIPDHDVARSVAELRDARPLISTAEFTRAPIEGIEHLLGRVNLAADGRALVVGARTLLVIPLERVVRVEVHKLRKAKGPGGSGVALICSTGVAGEKSIAVGRGAAPNDLDALAVRLGEDIGVPVHLGEPMDDA